MIQGSCLCGGVHYEAARSAAPMANCHCHLCQKAHGAAYSTILPVDPAGFRWTRGEAKLRHYESSPGKKRWFCATCGSHLVSTRDGQEGNVLLRAGTIDRGFSGRAVAHGWVSSKANWHEIADDLPRFDEGFPGAPRSRQ